MAGENNGYVDESNNSAGKALDFLKLVGHLKHLKRTGWVMKGIENPETVTSHMYRMSVMTFLLHPSSDVNRLRCMELALVHDLAECIVGDITPYCGVSVEEKHKRELEAMKEITGLIPMNGDYVFKLYEEYEKQESNEAKLVKEFDRLDMIVQAFEYENRDELNVAGKLQEFFDSCKGKFSNPDVLSIVQELEKRRKS